MRGRAEVQAQRLDILGSDWGQNSGWVGCQVGCVMPRLGITPYHPAGMASQHLLCLVLFDSGHSGLNLSNFQIWTLSGLMSSFQNRELSFLWVEISPQGTTGWIKDHSWRRGGGGGETRPKPNNLERKLKKMEKYLTGDQGSSSTEHRRYGICLGFQAPSFISWRALVGFLILFLSEIDRLYRLQNGP